MNRILQAEVIITLTSEQAARMLKCVSGVVQGCGPDYKEMLDALREQCAKQGVSL